MFTGLIIILSTTFSLFLSKRNTRVHATMAGNNSKLAKKNHIKFGN